MGRFKHDDSMERTLPQRPRLNPPPDFAPRVVTEMDPANVPVLYRTPYLDGPARYMHVRVERSAQLTCSHDWGTAGRFGDAQCAKCEAWAWSKWWVAEGIYGLASTVDPDALDGTGLFLERTAAEWEHRSLLPIDPGPTSWSVEERIIAITLEEDES